MGSFRPHNEAAGQIDCPQTRMKPGLVRDRVYCSYNNFTTNENLWSQNHRLSRRIEKALEGHNTDNTPKGVPKRSANCISFSDNP